MIPTLEEVAPKRGRGFAIVYKASTSRSPLAAAGGITSTLVKLGRSERLFPPQKGERAALGATSASASLGRFFLVMAGDMGETADLLEKLQASDSVELAYVAPPRFVLTTRRRAFVAGGTPPTHDFRDQVRWSAAQALPQWTITQPVALGVLDSGFDRAHPQLAHATYQQYLTNPGAQDDALGHGTHVFGQLVAASNAGNAFEGLVGDCSVATMSCALADPYDAAGYYRGLRAACTARLVNLSVGGEHEDPLETEIIQDALDRDAIVVAAMGNEADLGSPVTYPAAIEGVVAVGAVDHAGNRASFSNEGDHILISAPGVNIMSTVPTYPVVTCTPTGVPPLGVMSGTSMATPIVTAVTARMLAFKPSLSRVQVIDFIKAGHSTWNSEVGWGVIDACTALGAV